MNDCAREMTHAEKAKFIMAVLECGGYNMPLWERDYLKSVLQEKVVEMELIKEVKESQRERNELELYPLSSYSTTQLKKELRRRKKQ